MDKRKDIEKACKRIVRVSRDGQAYYHYGVEYSSDEKKPTYKAYIGWSKEGVEPLSFSAQTVTKLLEEMDEFTKDTPHSYIAVKWHQANIKQLERLAASHKDMILQYQALEEVKNEDIHS